MEICDFKEGLQIKEIIDHDEIPLDLLLLADPSKDMVESYLQRGKTFGCFKNNELVGVYILIYTRPKTMEIVNIAVSEKYQRKGIGKFLIEHALQKAKELGVKTVEIGTGNSSLSQLGLYQKCGFRIVGIDRDFFKRHYDENIVENGIECVDMIRLSKDL